MLVLYFTCRYYPKFLRSSILCKFQLEYISSGKLKLLDFILGDNTLFYFMEVSFMITSSNIWYKFSQLSNYSLKHWLLIVHHVVRLFTALITSLVMNVCLYILLTVYGARECILPTPVLVDSWEFYCTAVQSWPYTWHQSRYGWCNCYLWKVHHSTGTLLKHITDTCQIVFEMVKILWLHSCTHDSPCIGSNLFMHVIVTKSPPFENVRGVVIWD